MTVRSLAKTVNVASVGAAQPLGLVDPGPAAELSTATVAELPIRRSPPKNPLISGVKKLNGAFSVTVSVLPAPAPPGDRLQAMVTSAGVAHLVVMFSG